MVSEFSSPAGAYISSEVINMAYYTIANIDSSNNCIRYNSKNVCSRILFNIDLLLYLGKKLSALSWKLFINYNLFVLIRKEKQYNKT